MRKIGFLLILAISCSPAIAPLSLASGIEEQHKKILVGLAGVKSLESIPKLDFSWGWIRWMMNSKINLDAQQTFGIVQLNPGKKNPLHSHPNCEELLYVVSGSCKKTIGEKTHLLKAGDLVRIPMGVSHRAVTVGEEPMLAVIVYSSPNRQMLIHGE